jgi:hypothetical protein
MTILTSALSQSVSTLFKIGDLELDCPVMRMPIARTNLLRWPEWWRRFPYSGPRYKALIHHKRMSSPALIAFHFPC